QRDECAQEKEAGCHNEQRCWYQHAVALPTVGGNKGSNVGYGRTAAGAEPRLGYSSRTTVRTVARHRIEIERRDSPSVTNSPPRSGLAALSEGAGRLRDGGEAARRGGPAIFAGPRDLHACSMLEAPKEEVAWPGATRS